MNAGEAAPNARASAGELTAWREEFDGAALIGTARRPAPPAPAAFSISPPPDRSRETLLLDLAAFDDVVGRSDPQVHGSVPLEPAAIEPRATASPHAAEVLGTLLRAGSGDNRLSVAVGRLIREWFDAAEEHGVVVPPRMLPALLRFDRDARMLGPHAAWGTRGTWLRAATGAGDPAELTPVPIDDLAGLLTEATPQAARDIVRRLVGTDPAEVVTVVRTVWPKLLAETRSQVLSALPTAGTEEPAGLVEIGPEVDAFLEEALDDRAQSVREAARRTAAKYPNSSFAARMADRLRPLVVVERKLLGGRVVSVRTPSEADEDAIRDGLQTKRGATAPDLSAWGDEILRVAPLSVWSEVVPGDDDKVAQLVVAGLTDRQREGILRAIETQHAIGWARGLIDGPHGGRLLRLLPVTEREPIALARLRRHAGTTYVPRDELAAVSTPWSDELGRLALEFACPAPPRVDANGRPVWSVDGRWFRMYSDLPSRLPVALEPRMRELIAVDRDDSVYREFRSVLTTELRARELAAALAGAFS